jgi:mRNA interferase HigB
MRVIAEKTLRLFWEKHADARGSLEAWLEHVKRSHWQNPAELSKDYGDEVILPHNRAVFKIKGNQYRLIVQIHYKSSICFIRFIGTHSEYDKIDVMKV